MNLRARHKRSRRSSLGIAGLIFLSAMASEILLREREKGKSQPSVSMWLPARVIPVALRQFFIMPVRSDQALERVAQHSKVVPVAKLIELARAGECFDLRQSHRSLSARLAQPAQRQREQHVFSVQAALVITAHSGKIIATAKGKTGVQTGDEHH